MIINRRLFSYDQVYINMQAVLHQECKIPGFYLNRVTSVLSNLNTEAWMIVATEEQK